MTGLDAHDVDMHTDANVGNVDYQGGSGDIAALLASGPHKRSPL